MADGASRGKMCWMASVYFCTAENCLAQSLTVSPISPAWETGASRRLNLSASLVSTRLSHRWRFWNTNMDIAFPRDCAVTSVARRARSVTEQSSCVNLGLVLSSCILMRTIPPSGGVLWAQVHHIRTLCLGNAHITPSRPVIKGSEDGEADEPILAIKCGRPRHHQLLMHFLEERNQCRVWSRATARAEEPIISPQGLGTGKCALLQPDPRDGPGTHISGTEGGVLPNRYPRRTISHPPMLRSISDPLSAGQIIHWAHRETAQQNHQGAAQKICMAGADLVNWGPQANIGMGPYTFAHIYQDHPLRFLFLLWCLLLHNGVP